MDNHLILLIKIVLILSLTSYSSLLRVVIWIVFVFSCLHGIFFPNNIAPTALVFGEMEFLVKFGIQNFADMVRLSDRSSTSGFFADDYWVNHNLFGIAQIFPSSVTKELEYLKR